MSKSSIYTKAVHAGDNHSEHYGALSVPIYQASVYAFPDADEGAAIHNEEKDGYYYGRLGNPTQTALENAVTDLENGEAALALASGMAAISAAIFTLVKTGEHIVAPQSMYATRGPGASVGPGAGARNSDGETRFTISRPSQCSDTSRSGSPW